MAEGESEADDVSFLRTVRVNHENVRKRLRGVQILLSSSQAEQ